jgi:type II secretory pathway component GspD/PulD (secretin)
LVVSSGSPNSCNSSSSRKRPTGKQGQRVGDDRTNTIVVAVRPTRLKIVERVVKEIDSNPAADEAVFIYSSRTATRSTSSPS